MGNVIYIEEWKKRKREEKMWKNLSANGYNIEPLQKLWEEGEIFFMTHSSSFPVTVMETSSNEDAKIITNYDLEEGNYSLE